MYSSTVEQWSLKPKVLGSNPNTSRYAEKVNRSYLEYDSIYFIGSSPITIKKDIKIKNNKLIN